MSCPGSNLSNEQSYEYSINLPVLQVSYLLSCPFSVLSSELRILSTELSSKYPMKCLVSILSNEMSCKYPMNHYECHTSILSNELSCEYSFQLAFPQVSYPLSSPPKFASILPCPANIKWAVLPIISNEWNSSIISNELSFEYPYPLSCPASILSTELPYQVLST